MAQHQPMIDAMNDQFGQGAVKFDPLTGDLTFGPPDLRERPRDHRLEEKMMVWWECVTANGFTGRLDIGCRFVHDSEAKARDHSEALNAHRRWGTAEGRKWSPAEKVGQSDYIKTMPAIGDGWPDGHWGLT